jgi:RNA polymerase sigma-70 factor (ECF subfamily)
VTPDPVTVSPLARFEALFRAHERAVLAYAMRRTSMPADAEDAAAETFAIAWRKLEAVPVVVDEALPWLYAVARRVLANQRRGIGRRERLAALLQVRDVPTPQHVGEAQDGPAFEALARLSASDQELLRLVAWEELGNQQIAVVLGITTNAVAIRLHRARQRFSAALKSIDPSRTSTQVQGTNDAPGTADSAWKGVPK